MRKIISIILIGLFLYPTQSFAFSILAELMNILQGVQLEAQKVSQKEAAKLDEEILEKEGEGGPRESFSSETNILSVDDAPPLIAPDIASEVDKGDLTAIAVKTEEVYRPRGENSEDAMKSQDRHYEMKMASSINAFGVSQTLLSSIKDAERESKDRIKQVKKAKDTRQVQVYSNDLDTQIADRLRLINYLDLTYMELVGSDMLGKLPPSQNKKKKGE